MDFSGSTLAFSDLSWSFRWGILFFQILLGAAGFTFPIYGCTEQHLGPGELINPIWGFGNSYTDDSIKNASFAGHVIDPSIPEKLEETSASVPFCCGSAADLYFPILPWLGGIFPPSEMPKLGRMA